MNYATLGKNALLYSISTTVLRAAAFVLIPIYTYSLSVAEYGLLSVLLQTAQIFVIVIGIGSRTALVRFAKEHEQKGELGALIGTSVFVNVIGAAVVTSMSLLFLLPLFRDILHTEDVVRYVLLTCAAAASNCLAFHVMTYYRAGEKGMKVTLATSAAAVVLVVLTALFVKVMHWGIEGALIAQTVLYSLLAGCLLIIIAFNVRLTISLPLTWRLIRFGLPLILVMSGGLITQTSALYFLSYFRGLSDVGIYSLGLKLAAIAEMILILPFEMAYEPFVYGHIGHPALWNTISRLLTYLLLAYAFVACGIVFIIRDVLPIVAPPDFNPAYFITFLLMPAFACRCFYYIGESLLFVEKRTGTAGTVVTFFSLLSIALNYLMTSLWGMHGTVVVHVFTAAAIGMTVLWLGLKTAPVRVEWNRVCAAAMLLLVLLAAVYALRNESALVYYSAVPAIILLGVLTLFLTGFMRDDEKRALQQLAGRAQRLGSVQDV